MSPETVKQIQQIVENEWERESSPILLSQIPTELHKYNIDLKRDLGLQKLREAINETHNTNLRIIKDPNDEKLLALVPRHVEDSDRELFLALRNRLQKRKAQSLIRYDYVVWSAFSKPLTAARRYIIFADKTRFTDIDDISNKPEGSYEVESDLVRTEGESIEEKDIAKRIELWLGRHSISRDSVLQKTSTKPQSSSFGAFAELSQEDRERILVPLDIVMKLFK